MNKSKISQNDLIKEYFIANPRKDVKHAECVPWLMEEYKKRTGNVFADPDRGIRKLAQTGFLVKKSKGVYYYDPDFISNKHLEDFTESQKNEIKKRDDYKCVLCGKGINDGIEIQVDHIKPKDLGGRATIENGQTLCAAHNFKKKNYNQTESGKKFFIKLYELARNINDKETESFCKDLLSVYEKYNMNGHIEWKK